MFLNILKKDLKRKRTMNIILFIFIVIATAFLSSSTNNMIATNSAVDNFLDQAKVPDFMVLAFKSDDNVQKFDKWFKECEYITSYSQDETVVLNKDNLTKKNGDSYNLSQTLVAQKEPTKNMLVFDENDNLVELAEGEIAIPNYEADINDLKAGDKLEISFDGKTREFTIKCLMKDAAFGTSYMDLKRFIFNNNDYDSFIASGDRKIEIFYSIDTDNVIALQKDFKQQQITVVAALGRDTMEMVYVMDMMIAGILMIVSVCLILISFLILRFTIVFTVQEDYKEIGIMKAIGIKNKGIKGIYIIKYLTLSVVGSIFGLFISIPFGKILLKQVSRNIVMDNSNQMIYINICCAVAIVIIVVGFCYLCTSKLNKISAIDAIRNGSTGERFKSKSILKLHNTRKISTVIYLAVNDILGNLRNFSVLIITFAIGTVLIILPLNAINTLKDDKLVKLFGMTQSDVYITPQNSEKYITNNSEYNFYEDMEKLEQKYHDNGVNVKLCAESGFSFNVYGQDKEDVYTLFTSKGYKTDINKYDMLSGTAPVLKNEVAITEKSAKKLGVTIGDTVYSDFGGNKYEFLVTGLFESMNTLGESMRISTDLDISMVYSAGFNFYQGDFADHSDIDGQIEKLKQLTPDYKICDSAGIIKGYLGSTIEQIDSLKKLIIFIVLGINALITVLMMKTFITKEKGQIAMLKCIGFSNRSIQYWQVIRILIVLIIGIAIGVVASNLLNEVTIGEIFNMMGASQLKMTVNPLEVYLIYPLILLVVTGIVATASVRMIKNINLKEINNME